MRIKGKSKEKEERKENEEKKKGEEENCAWRRKKNGLRFPVFRRSEVVSQRIKVGLLDKSYE